jgi:hypothetical protein
MGSSAGNGKLGCEDVVAGKYGDNFPREIEGATVVGADIVGNLMDL